MRPKFIKSLFMKSVSKESIKKTVVASCWMLLPFFFLNLLGVKEFCKVFKRRLILG